MSTHESFEAAREQAAEYLGFLASENINGFEIPNPSLIDDDQQARLDRLNFDSESWDRHPDEFLSEAKAELGKKVQEVLGEDSDTALVDQMVDVFVRFAKDYRGTIMAAGQLKVPHRKDGELVENYDVQQAKAILGDRYEAFRSAGGRASDITITWWKMNKMLADRRAADSKSGTGGKPVAVVPDPD